MPQLSARQRQIAELLADCYDDPGLFHEAVLGRSQLWPKQEAIARSVVQNRYTIVPTAHAMGKTWYAPTAILHWLYTRPNSMVVTTSPSNTHLVNALWGGIKAAFKGSPIKLAGRICEGSGSPQYLQIGPKWYAIGWAAKKPESFQGQRPDGGDLLVVTDESSGIDQPIWDAIESLGATSHLVLGNPIRARGHFRTLYDIAMKGEPGYKAFRMTAFDSPYSALTDEQIIADGLPKGLVSKSWIDKTRRTYGESSLYWRTRVLANFPDEDHDALIPPEWLDHAYASRRSTATRGGTRRLSVDISKGTGRDRTVAMVGDNLGLLQVIAANTVSLVEASVLTARLAEKWGIDHENIVYDAGGWAGPDFATYLEAKGITDATPYHGSSSGGARWKNKRTRAAWALRQRLDPTRDVIIEETPIDNPFPAIANTKGQPRAPRSRKQPPFVIAPSVIGEHWDDLRQEVLELKYSHDTAKIELEKKEDLVERLGRSPDLADALLMMASLWGIET